MLRLRHYRIPDDAAEACAGRRRPGPKMRLPPAVRGTETATVPGSSLTLPLEPAAVPELSAALVRALIAEQLPQWAHLPVRPVPRQGWDNRTFRLGDDLSVRLPSAPGYAPGVAKEDRWLPVLANHLPVPVPTPVAVGRPSPSYPLPWSVRRWLPGEALDVATEVEPSRLAADLGSFLRTLRRVPTAGAPPAGQHSFLRGCPPAVYDDDVDTALAALGDRVPQRACRAIWDAATEPAPTEQVWFHGDVAAGNLLIVDGALAAVIDFGTCGVGDPACDLVIAWTWFDAGTRGAFAAAVDLPPGAWRRARGWALWKALITLADPTSAEVERVQRRALQAVVDDPVVA